MKSLLFKDRLILAVLVIIIATLIGGIMYLILFEVRRDTFNKNFDVSNTNQLNINSQINISRWNTYQNEELGLIFRYPEEFGDISVLVKTKDDYPAVESGESLIIQFSKNPYISGQID